MKKNELWNCYELYTIKCRFQLSWKYRMHVDLNCMPLLHDGHYFYWEETTLPSRNCKQTVLCYFPWGSTICRFTFKVRTHLSRKWLSPLTRLEKKKFENPIISVVDIYSVWNLVVPISRLDIVKNTVKLNFN